MSSDESEIVDVAIIGAGLSGLSAARALIDAGQSVRVLDKGRGVGGRMATRRIEGEDEGEDGKQAAFDHGAQFFTARSPEFKAEMARWQAAGLASEWFHGQSTLQEDGSIDAKPDGHPRFCCPRGMTAITKYLAADVPVRTAARITRLQHQDGVWSLFADDGLLARARSLVLTPPVPQSLDLLRASAIELPKGSREILEPMCYERCIAVMLMLSEPPSVGSEGALYARTEKLSWLGDNARKGISERPALTLHGAPDWSTANWEASDSDVVRELSEAARAFWSGEILASSVARWKFSKPIEPRDDGSHLWHSKRLVFAGDAFGGAKVEGAWLSGQSAARAVLSF